MMRKNDLKKIMITGVASLSLIAPVVLTPIASVLPTSVTASANSISSQVEHFAKQRHAYYYSNIASNARDLGGYKTINGKYMVKPGKLIRSSSLHCVDSKGYNHLLRLGVTQDLDLRTYPQLEPHRDFSEVNNNSIRIHHDIIYTQYSHDHDYGNHYRNLYENTSEAKREYRNAINQILDNSNNSTVYHCIQGRDRTGILTILLLSALGVSRNDINNDYLLSTYYYGGESYTHLRENLRIFYHVMDSQYGGVKGYLRDIGIGNSKMAQLRKDFLVPKDNYGDYVYYQHKLSSRIGQLIRARNNGWDYWAQKVQRAINYDKKQMNEDGIE